MEKETLTICGILRAHTDWVTAIATTPQNSNMIVSSSRDKSLIIWDLTKYSNTFLPTSGVPRTRLTGQKDFIQDVVITSNGMYAISASLDSELRLWDLNEGTSLFRFVGHTKDVLSVSLSPDNSKIVSSSRDKRIKLWNTLGDCEHTFKDPEGHSDWVSCVRFSPDVRHQHTDSPIVVSGSWDRTVKVWNMANCTSSSTMHGHVGYVEAVAVSPDGAICASGGKEGVILLWDVENGIKLRMLDAGSIVHALCFSPNRYLLCAATESSIKIWNLENLTNVVDLKHNSEIVTDNTAQATAGMNKVNFTAQATARKKKVICTCLNWSADGTTLYSGYTDGVIIVWGYLSHIA